MTIRETTYFTPADFRAFTRDTATGALLARARAEANVEGVAVNFASYQDALAFADLTGRFVAGTIVRHRDGCDVFLDSVVHSDMVGRIASADGARGLACYFLPEDLVAPRRAV